MTNLAILDIIFLVVLAVFVIRVSIRGFVEEFFSKVAVIGGAIVGVLFYKMATPLVVDLIGKHFFAGLIAFLALFLITYLVVKVIQSLIGSALRIKTLSNLDKAAGFFLGILEGFLVIIIVLIILNIQPLFEVQKILRESLFYQIFQPLIIDSTTLFKQSVAFGV